jgi:phenylalanyl-tRNA synthetase alpha chain
MQYADEQVKAAAKQLREKFEKLEDKQVIRRAPELGALYEQIKNIPPGKRASFGKQINELKQEIEGWIKEHNTPKLQRDLIDITAPFDVNAGKPGLLPTQFGTRHPLMTELEKIIGIFSRMGFETVESPEIDDDYHMFTSLNFPEDHPARDDYDTFVTEEGFIAPAHTSTMQNRVLKERKTNLESGDGIRVIMPGRVFRNEDLDARHEHTFYQVEGVCVGVNLNVANLIATLKTFLETYFSQELEVKTQPFYFPFTEPSFEFALSCPFCKKQGCNVCSYTGWIELLGCGMIHPNVLKEAGINPAKYSGFAWGMGIDRLVMMKNDIEDVRHFESGNLNFLRQFS